MAIYNYYQVGGSLRYGHPTYVERRADQDLYKGLKNKEFCYVLNSRQMGKSSLRVQAMKTLSKEGIKCASIDMGKLGSSTTSEKWYGGLVSELVRGFSLTDKIDDNKWWQSHENLSPVLRLSRFIENVLLTQFEQNIVIFIDEIDSIIKVDFKDDFFTFIRACYNQRVDIPDYERLTFCLLGVATPSSLIQDKSRTPFNIGQAIELTGFTLDEAKRSLSEGLEKVAENPESILEEILYWTGGQPFLTQKLCQIITRTHERKLPNIEQLVHDYIIVNWETQDEPEHLKTIRDRILWNGGQLTSRVLGLYQQILQSGQITANDSYEQTELRLSGLVVRYEGRLRICNHIYEEIFTEEWLSNALADLRPYAVVLTAWIESNYQDESRLLRGEALEEAQTWAAGKSLSDLDYRFLAASQELGKRDIQKQLKTEERAKQILQAANYRAKQTIHWGQLILTAILTVAIIVGGFTWWSAQQIKQNSAQQIKRNSTIAYVELKVAASEAAFLSGQELTSLLEALRAGHQLKSLDKSVLNMTSITDLQTRVSGALYQAVYNVKEYNSLEKHDQAVEGISFSPDGKMLASASDDSTIKLWNLDGNELRTLKGHERAVLDISFSPDGKMLASASYDNTIKLWSLDGNELRTLKGQKPFWDISFSPDGKTLASASHDNTIKLWSLDGNELRTLKGHQGRVYGVSFSPDGKTLASASDDHTIKLWSLDGNELRTLEGHQGRVYSVSFSPDGKTLASASYDNTIKLWNLDGNELRTLEGHQGRVYSVSFSLDGKTLASTSDDLTVKLWGIHGNELRTFKGHQSVVLDVRFSPDGKTLASASDDRTIKLWNIDGRELKTPEKQSSVIWGIDFSSDGKMLASAGDDGTIKLWSIDGRELRTLKGHQVKVSCVRFSFNGKMLASAGDDGTIKLWSIDGRELRTLKGHQRSVQDIRFSPDGNFLASTSDDDTIKLWSIDGRELRTLKGHQGISFSPDGILAAASGDGTVELWSLNGRKLKILKGYQGSILYLSFSPDGKMLASANSDNSVTLWKFNEIKPKILKGHQGTVWSIGFSPDSKTLASAGDNSIILWNLDGIKLRVLKGHQSIVTGVSFSPDGKILASSSADKTIRFWHWNWDLDSLMHLGCDWLHDYFITNPNVKADDRKICRF
jgi:WD40 repeat protein